jgi:hypothetical protein
VADRRAETRSIDQELRRDMEDKYGSRGSGREREAENIEMPCPIIVTALYY